jgi:hypothetical protein
VDSVRCVWLSSLLAKCTMQMRPAYASGLWKQSNSKWSQKDRVRPALRARSAVLAASFLRASTWEAPRDQPAGKYPFAAVHLAWCRRAPRSQMDFNKSSTTPTHTQKKLSV